MRAGHCFKEGQENIEKPMFGRYIMIYLWLLWSYIYITMVIADVSIVNYDLWYLTMVYIYISRVIVVELSHMLHISIVNNVS